MSRAVLPVPKWITECEVQLNNSFGIQVYMIFAPYNHFFVFRLSLMLTMKFLKLICAP